MPTTTPKITPEQHHQLGLWAADCAEDVLPFFEEQCPGDLRPRQAVEAARAWTRGELRVGQARTFALAAHAAARDAPAGPARAAARACGHAAATAHVATHSRAAADYAAQAVGLHAAAAQRARQSALLAQELWPVGFASREPAIGLLAVDALPQG